MIRGVVIAGGLGTRLASYSASPKPLVEVNGKPMLRRVLECQAELGITEVTLILGHRHAEVLEATLSWDLPMALHSVVEEQPLGTAGGLSLIGAHGCPTLVMNTDVMIRPSEAARLIDDHRCESSAASALVHEVQWTLPYGSVIVGDRCRQILSITEKPSQQHLVLTGVYVLDDRVLGLIPSGQRYDMPRLLLDAVAKGHPVRAVRTTGEWFDVGTPDTLRQAEQVVGPEPSSVGGSPVTGPPVQSLGRILTDAVATAPDRAALVANGESLTYQQLDEAVQQRSEALLASGVVPGDVVLVDGAANFEFVISAWSVWTVGAALAVAHPGCAPVELERLRQLVRPRVELRGKGSFAAETGTAGVTTPEVQLRDPALVVATSGSTGEPKAVVCPLSQVWFSLDAIQERLGYRDDDVVLLTLPMAFDYGLYQLLLAARVAATVALRSPDNLLSLANDVERYKATVVPGTPSILRALARTWCRRPRAGHVRLLTNTGERLDEAVQQQIAMAFPGAAMALMYGITECKRISIEVVPVEALPKSTSGFPLRGVSVRVVNSQGESVAEGDAGEIVVSGGNLTDGYLRDPDATARRFRWDMQNNVRELWTGDFGRLIDGRVVVEHRIDGQRKLNGVRVEAGEIERAAELVSGVERAVLVPLPGGDPVLVVMGVAHVEEVRAALEEHLNRAKIPRRVESVPELPLTRNGKIAVPELVTRLN